MVGNCGCEEWCEEGSGFTERGDAEKQSSVFERVVENVGRSQTVIVSVDRIPAAELSWGAWSALEDFEGDLNAVVCLVLVSGWLRQEIGWDD